MAQNEGTDETQFPPSDRERVQVLTRLIDGRIADLSTAKAEHGFTAADARELFVLETLRREWLEEAGN